MDATTLAVVLVPFIVLVIVVGVVIVVALCQARPEDVPVVVREGVKVFVRLSDRLPQLKDRSGPHNDLLGPSSAQVDSEPKDDS